jgi:hypothetical protein
MPLLAERALRAEPVPVAAASLRRRRPQEQPSWLLSPALWLSPRQPQRGDPMTSPAVERCERSERRATLGRRAAHRDGRAVGVAPRPGRPKTAIQRVSRRPDAASAIHHGEHGEHRVFLHLFKIPAPIFDIPHPLHAWVFRASSFADVFRHSPTPRCSLCPLW